jgi:hypothetical protein
LNGNGVSAERLDLFTRGLGRLFAAVRDVVDNDLLTRFPYLKCNGPAETARRSSHKNNLGVVGGHVQGGGSADSTESDGARECTGRSQAGGEEGECGEELHGLWLILSVFRKGWVL